MRTDEGIGGCLFYCCRCYVVVHSHLICLYLCDAQLAGSEGQTALGTKEEFVNGLKLAMSKGKLHLNSKQMKGIEEMYKTRSLEAGCINVCEIYIKQCAGAFIYSLFVQNGLTQLQSIFGELIKKKISKSQGLGLRKVLSSFISLKSAYAILFTLSASANNNKVTRSVPLNILRLPVPFNICNLYAEQPSILPSKHRYSSI